MSTVSITGIRSSAAVTEIRLADSRLPGNREVGTVRDGGIPHWPEDIAVRTPGSRVHLSPQDFERQMFDFATRLADPNASSRTRNEVISAAVSLLSRQGYTWNPITNRKFNGFHIGHGVFLPYVERVMGYRPIIGEGVRFANGWELRHEFENNKFVYQIVNRNPTKDGLFRVASLDSDRWNVYIKGDAVYISKRESKPDGKHVVALQFPLSFNNSRAAPPTAFNQTGLDLLKSLNGGE
jgi:hypothetical protein